MKRRTIVGLTLLVVALGLVPVLPWPSAGGRDAAPPRQTQQQDGARDAIMRTADARGGTGEHPERTQVPVTDETGVRRLVLEHEGGRPAGQGVVIAYQEEGCLDIGRLPWSREADATGTVAWSEVDGPPRGMRYAAIAPECVPYQLGWNELRTAERIELRRAESVTVEVRDLADNRIPDVALACVSGPQFTLDADPGIPSPNNGYQVELTDNSGRAVFDHLRTGVEYQILVLSSSIVVAEGDCISKPVKDGSRRLVSLRVGRYLAAYVDVAPDMPESIKLLPDDELASIRMGTSTLAQISARLARRRPDARLVHAMARDASTFSVSARAQFTGLNAERQATHRVELVRPENLRATQSFTFSDPVGPDEGRILIRLADAGGDVVAGAAFGLFGRTGIIHADNGVERRVPSGDYRVQWLFGREFSDHATIPRRISVQPGEVARVSAELPFDVEEVFLRLIGPDGESPEFAHLKWSNEALGLQGQLRALLPDRVRLALPAGQVVVSVAKSGLPDQDVVLTVEPADDATPRVMPVKLVRTP